MKGLLRKLKGSENVTELEKTKKLKAPHTTIYRIKQGTSEVPILTRDANAEKATNLQASKNISKTTTHTEIFLS